LRHKASLGDGDAAAWSRPVEAAFMKGFEAVNRIPVAFAGRRLCRDGGRRGKGSFTSGVIADMTEA
jgi:hypothetical protein